MPAVARAQLTPAVHFIAGSAGAPDPQGLRAVQGAPASCGWLANITSSGTPASSRCSLSAAHRSGRESARPISACPQPLA